MTMAVESQVQLVSRNRSRWLASILLPILGIAILIGVWWGIKAASGLSSFILPSPGEVAERIVTARSQLFENGLVTLVETLAGFFLAIVIGIPIGVALAYSWVFDKMLSPILFGFNAIPKVAIAPLLVIWMGFSIQPKIVMVLLLCFFPITLATAAGINATPMEFRELIRSLEAGPIQTFFKVRLPAALPYIFVGLKLAISLAIIGAVIGEFAGATSGLGYLIIVSGGSADTTLAFASLFVLGAMSIVLYYLLVWAERLLVPWEEQQ